MASLRSGLKPGRCSGLKLGLSHGGFAKTPHPSFLHQLWWWEEVTKFRIYRNFVFYITKKEKAVRVTTEVAVLTIIALAIIFLLIGYISDRANVVRATGMAASRIEMLKLFVCWSRMATIKNMVGMTIIFIRAIRVPCQKYLSISIFWAIKSPIAIKTIGEALLESICIAMSIWWGIFMPVIRNRIPSVIAIISGFVAMLFIILARFACLFFEYSKMNSPRVNAMMTWMAIKILSSPAVFGSSDSMNGSPMYATLPKNIPKI